MTKVIGMTQYFVCNFTDKTKKSPSFISTYDISSCIIVILRNIDSKNKTTSSFGMAHVNLTDVFFEGVAEENFRSYLNDFLEIGGKLDTDLKIEILGGLLIDENDVQGKILKVLHKFVKSPKIIYFLHTKIDGSLLERKKGNIQKLTVSCDNKNTYTRKITFKEGKVVKKEFEPQNSLLLTDENLRNIVLVEKEEHQRLQLKTNQFFKEVNPIQDKTVNQIFKIQKDYCFFECVK